MERSETFGDIFESECPSLEIAAYIDGELDAEAEARFESHLSTCRVCGQELNDQKNFINALNGSLGSGLELPADFTRRVVASAESGVSGLRQGKERLSAMFVCCALFFFVLFTLGAGAPGAFASALGVFARAGAVASFLAHVLYDISLGVVVILRTISGQPVFGAAALFVMIPITIGLAVRYSQARASRERIEYSESGSLF